MSFRRVAVIGGSGFIGRYVVEDVAQSGAVVTVIGRHATEAMFLRPMGGVGQVALVNASLAEEDVLKAALRDCEAVVNCAGILHEGGGQTFDLLHHQGPARLARIAKAAGASHFVHISALGADANSPSSYARSKAAGELAVREVFPAATILRPSVVFGPEDQFFNRFASMACTLPFLPLIGGGLTRFQPVFVNDVADAVEAALEQETARGRTFELCGPKVYSFKELMEMMLLEIRGKKTLVSLPFGLASLKATFLEWLPNPPLTRDQVKLLQRDNVLAPGALTLLDLGVTPTAVELVLPMYMDRFRKGGRWAA